MSRSLCWALAGAAAAVVLAPLLLIAMVTVTTPAVGQQLAEQRCATSPRGSAAAGPDAANRFTIGTLNWRGAAHYHRNPHPRETPYTVRVPHMIDKITAAGASIVGFQEFEKPQARDFLRLVGSRWALVRGKAATGRPDTRNAIAYQPARWRLDQVRFLRIGYGGARISIPLARFTARDGTATLWVLNSHNPANAVGGTPAIRDVAVRSEATALSRLAANHRAEPVLFTGDMNDRARFERLFLRVAGAGWTAANRTTGQIDWIIGGPGIRFTDTVIDHSTKDGAHHYTDHPYVHTVASLTDARSGRTHGRRTAGRASAVGGAAPETAAGAREGGLGFPLPEPGRLRLASLHTPAASIPPAIKTVYLRAAARYQLPWTLLAGIGMEETDHGRNTHPSSAGAQGLMQFLPATFARYGVDGDHDGHADITDPADSAMSAANYLTAAGVAQGPAGVRHALYAYNHADWYVNDVLYYARAYGGGTLLGDPTDCGPTAESATGNPALPPLTSSRVTSLLRWAQDQLGDPYQFGANGPNAWDCSSYTRGAYAHLGITLPRTAQAQRDWLAAGNGYRVPLDQERPGDLVFTDTYLGPARVGHVMIVFNPTTHASIEAVGSHVQYDHYTRYSRHHIFEIWRVGNLTDHAPRNG